MPTPEACNVSYTLWSGRGRVNGRGRGRRWAMGNFYVN